MFLTTTVYVRIDDCQLLMKVDHTIQGLSAQASNYAPNNDSSLRAHGSLWVVNISESCKTSTVERKRLLLT